MFLRLFVAMLFATVLVVTGMSLAVSWFYDAEDEGDSTYEFMNRVGLTTLEEYPELQEEAEEPELPEFEPTERPEREVQGFVQLEFTVLPDGSVEDVEVIGAQPSGVYEERARQQIRARNFAHQADPEATDGVRRTEIVDFTVPASELQDR